jgi:serine/threonine protein kinase
LERYEVGETIGVGGKLRAWHAGVASPARERETQPRRHRHRRVAATTTHPPLTTPLNPHPPPPQTGFAVVKRGRDRLTSEPVAIKVVDKSRYAAGDTSLEREIQVLCKVDHPNCIRLHSVFVTARKVYLVTELVTGGELLDRITERGHYPEREAAGVVRQILRGVAYLHR